jgi:hypothetical protein
MNAKENPVTFKYAATHEGVNFEAGVTVLDRLGEIIKQSFKIQFDAE